MSRNLSILPICVLLSCLVLPIVAATRSNGDEKAASVDATVPDGPVLRPAMPPYTRQPEFLIDEETEAPARDTAKTTEPEAPPKAEPKPIRELTPEMTALRDRVRSTLAYHRQRPLNTRDNSATEIMLACLPYGCQAEVLLDGSSGRKVNGITCLCWNYPCAGYEPLGICQRRIAARIGYGLQDRPSQLLAALAFARVPPTYPTRVGKDVRTVADLVEYEKLSCRSAADLSLKMIGLTHFVRDASWKNDLGEMWSVQRMVEEELAAPVVGARDDGMDRLMGLSYVLYRRAKREQPVTGQFARAQKFLNKYHSFALAHQNSDGSWSPRFVTDTASKRDPATHLHSTGRVLGWLALSLPEESLEDARIVRCVELVNRVLAGNRYRRNVRSLSTREIGSVMHALHALALYDERYFQPADPPAPEEKPAADTATVDLGGNTKR